MNMHAKILWQQSQAAGCVALALKVRTARQ
jgi:hypothetical protein